jgi:hypothetical protein
MFAMIGSLIVLGIFSTQLVNAQTTSIYQAFLTGPQESPPNASPGTGFATLTINTGFSGVDDSMTLQLSFSGLLGPTTASHIHAATSTPGTGTAGVATTTPFFSGFPIGVTSGSYSNTLDLTLASSYNPSYVTANGGTTAGAETALLAAIAADEAYLNIHSQSFSGGEIRGFLTPVPEPSAYALLSAGMTIFYVIKRRRA